MRGALPRRRARCQAALTATELVLAREQRLSALDGLAAAAAHELGTPLATIALVAKELKRELPAEGPHAEDLDLLIGQAARCREILARLANHDAEADEIYQRTKLLVMIEDLIEPLRGSEVEIAVTSSANDAGKAKSEEPIFRRNPAIAYGLGNLLENAVDFAGNKVEVDARWTPSSVSITVRDDGPGFQAGHLRPAGRSLRDDAARLWRGERRKGPAMTAWGLASSSPRRCSSARALPCRWPIGRHRPMERSFMWSGRVWPSMWAGPELCPYKS